MKAKRIPPSRQELEFAAEQVYNIMTRCFAYFLWRLKIHPIVSKVEDGATGVAADIQQNAVIEGTMLSIRKLNDFFRLPDHIRDDDVFASDFPGFNGIGNFLTNESFLELHRRVGHLTLREARHGKIAWDTSVALTAATSKYLEFTKYLRDDFFAANEQGKLRADEWERAIKALLRLADRYKALEEHE